MENNKNIAENKNGGFWGFIFRHKFTSFLVLLLIVGAGFAFVKFYALKRGFENEKQQLAGKYADETSKVFSWAIRSEMIRDNRDQVNQYFMTLVKEPGFKKIQLIDLATSKVIISTDKKDEGTAVTDTSILNANSVKQQITDNNLRSVVPVMGLNARLAVLIIDRSLPVTELNTSE